MTASTELPKAYKPFHEIVICSNRLINVKIPFEVDGGVPLLIGEGSVPRIWLSARPSEPGRPWRPIVRNNRVLHEAVALRRVGRDSVVLAATGVTLLRIQSRPNEPPEVMDLDLRPLGLKVYGDRKSLTIGTNVLGRNTFKGADVMVSIGGDSVQ